MLSPALFYSIPHLPYSNLLYLTSSCFVLSCSILF